MPKTLPATTPSTISTMATVTPSSTEIMLASRIRTLSTMATYRELSKPRSFPPAWQGEGPRHAILLPRRGQKPSGQLVRPVRRKSWSRKAGSIARIRFVKRPECSNGAKDAQRHFGGALRSPYSP
jgi:hypothetical protein